MATRTQKAAKKQKAEADKADKAHAKAHADAQEAVAKPKAPKKAAAKAAKKPAKAAAKPAKGKATKPAKSATPPPAEGGPEALPEPKRTSFAERFWHRIGMRAQKKESEAHKREAQLEFQEEQEQKAREKAAAAKARAEAAEERRKSARAAEEMRRAAIEEEKRLKLEAAQAKKQAKLDRAEKARQTRAAKAEEARRQQEEAEREEAERRQREQHEREVAQAAAAAEAQRKAREARKVEEFEPEPVEEPEPAVEFEPEPEPEPAPKAKPKPAARKPVEVVAAKVDEDKGEEEPDEEPAPAPKAARPPPPPAETELDRHADKLAAELAARRSKPITIEVEDDAVPMLPVGKGAKKEDEPKQVLELDPAPPATVPESSAIRGLSIPEHFLLLALDEGWDERTEKNRAGALGGALAGALVLELVMQGAVKVQRDRFALQNADLDDATEAVAQKLQQYAQLPSLRAMAELAKWLPQLLPAYKDRMARRGLIAHTAWRHLGLAYRSQTALLDHEAQERLRNKLARAIAGGGRPDAPTILSLGLLEASGLFGLVVPEGAQAYNRKRLNGLLGGKDVMGYKVDDQLKGIQEIAVRTVLDNVRVMTTKG